MEYEVFSKQMMVLEMLIRNRDLTQKAICDKVGISRRTFFRYIENFRYAGFEIVSKDNVFSVSIDSPFINKIMSSMMFNEDELNFIASAVSESGSGAAALSLKRKFRRVYGVDFDVVNEKSKVITNKIAKIQDAISRKKTVLFEKYSSPHSQTKTDRIVEPFVVNNSSGEVRCYELSSGVCKTFKISRIKRVLILEDKDWQFKKEHKTYYTDIFGFSGEEDVRVKLRLGFLAHRMLIEEYGVPDRLFHEEDDKHWIYYCHVCNFRGLGRFVLGLYNDIDVLENDDFKKYLKENIEEMQKKF